MKNLSVTRNISLGPDTHKHCNKAVVKLTLVYATAISFEVGGSSIFVSRSAAKADQRIGILFVLFSFPDNVN